jgi:hypothetical protein
MVWHGISRPRLSWYPRPFGVGDPTVSRVACLLLAARDVCCGGHGPYPGWLVCCWRRRTRGVALHVGVVLWAGQGKARPGSLLRSFASGGRHHSPNPPGFLLSQE